MTETNGHTGDAIPTQPALSPANAAVIRVASTCEACASMKLRSGTVRSGAFAAMRSGYLIGQLRDNPVADNPPPAGDAHRVTVRNSNHARHSPAAAAGNSLLSTAGGRRLGSPEGTRGRGNPGIHRSFPRVSTAPSGALPTFSTTPSTGRVDHAPLPA